MGRIIQYIIYIYYEKIKNVPNHQPGKNSKYYIKYLRRLTQITPLFCHTLRTFPDSPAWDLHVDLPDTRLAHEAGHLGSSSQGKIMGKSWQVAGKILEDLPLALFSWSLMTPDIHTGIHTWGMEKKSLKLLTSHLYLDIDLDVSPATVRTSESGKNWISNWIDLRINEPSSMAMFWPCWFCGPQNHLNSGHGGTILDKTRWQNHVSSVQKSLFLLVENGIPHGLW